MKLLGSYIDDTGGSFNLKGFQVDVFEIFILYLFGRNNYNWHLS